MKDHAYWSRLSSVAFILCFFTGFVCFADRTENVGKSFSLSELGKKVGEKADPGLLGIKGVDNVAEIVCKFQALEASVTVSGISIKSTSKTDDGGMFNMKVAGFGRSIDRLSPIASDADVSITGDCVRIVRPEFVEEYTVSVDGIRQDFIVLKKVEGSGELALSIGLRGATAELSGSGLKIRIQGMDRELAYSKLLVTDATGKKLDARFKINSASEFVITSDDSGAVYPIRIDPTISDANWISMGIVNPIHDVLSIAFDASGNLYAGGSFTDAGGLPVNHIVKWNGSMWSALGTGVDGEVYALAFDASGELYVGGKFNDAGGVSAKNIAKWNGAEWSTLGTGMDGEVYALAFDASGELYVGGKFNDAGGVSANNIAKWNGSAWSALGSGTGGEIYALAFDASGNLYTGGWFTSAGGVSANFIAKWDGSAWSALGSGMDSYVCALAFDSSGKLYAGGVFNEAGGVSASSIAKWNGSAWSALRSGMDGAVYSLAFNSGTLYVGGWFTEAGGVAVSNVAKWNGSAWSALGTEMGEYVSTIAFDSSGKIYAGGVSSIAKWNGSAWGELGSGMDGEVYALVFDASGNLYAGGCFTEVSGITVNNVAKWNGTSWSALRTGTDGVVYCLAFNSGSLYVGGLFTEAGGVTVNNVAKWNGSAWSTLRSGTDGVVYTLAFNSGNLYAGGGFAEAGGVSVNNIAKWNGSVWSTLGSGMDGEVYAFAFDSSGNLYAGGWFSEAGGVPANNIAKWNGSAWSALRTGLDGVVYSIVFDSLGDLYAGGWFTEAGGVPANNIARWNGSVWSALGSGMDGEVYTLAFNSGELYAGGAFINAGGVSANNIAKWNGTLWSALGSGMDSGVSALAFTSTGKFYAGGMFKTAGGKASTYLAKYSTDESTVPAAPTGVTAISGNMQATVSFIEPYDGGSDILSYTVTSYPGGITATGSDTSITVIGLSNGVAYTFKVTAANVNGRGPASEVSKAVTPLTVPDAPTIGKITAGIEKATVYVTGLNGGSPITFYTVTAYPSRNRVTSKTSPITVTGLTGGAPCTFKVSATNAIGTGLESESSADQPVTPTAVPSAPIVGLAVNGNAQATVAFTAPISNGGSPITSYTATSTPGNKTGTFTAKSTTASGVITIKGLTNGTAYTFKVTAKNAIGTGITSEASNEVTPAAVPGAPTNVKATAGFEEATVFFTAPKINGGSPIISYTATSTPGNKTVTFTAISTSGSMTVKGLTNGMTYTFKVTATNAEGTGIPSVSSNKVTLK